MPAQSSTDFLTRILRLGKFRGARFVAEGFCQGLPLASAKKTGEGACLEAGRIEKKPLIMVY
jgi:hypothetical protein